MSPAAVTSNKRLKIKVRENCVAICAHYMAAATLCDSSGLSRVCVYTQVGTAALPSIKYIHVGKHLQNLLALEMS